MTDDVIRENRELPCLVCGQEAVMTAVPGPPPVCLKCRDKARLLGATRTDRIDALDLRLESLTKRLASVEGFMTRVVSHLERNVQILDALEVRLSRLDDPLGPRDEVIVEAAVKLGEILKGGSP